MFFSTAAFAQNTLISGRIVDDKEQPVEFANVLLLNPVDTTLIKGTVTDSLGQYRFERVAVGSYLISATTVGMESVYSDVFEVTSGEATIKLSALMLGSSGVELDEVVVKGQKPFMEIKTDRLVMNVESSPVAAGNNALEVLAKAPGVSLDQDNRISLKGKQGVLVMIDGKNTYMSTEEVCFTMAAAAAGRTIPKTTPSLPATIRRPAARSTPGGMEKTAGKITP